MALVVKDRVRETSTTTGTGTLTLNGAVGGFQSFSVIGNANTTYYTIVDAATGAWEVGIGTYTAVGTTLSRDTILESSTGGTAVNFVAGTKDVFCTYPAERSVYVNNGVITPAVAATLPNTSITGLGTMSTQNSNNISVTGGTVDGVTIGGSTAAAGTFNAITDSGNLTFTGTGNRITGDFSNATLANRVHVQTSTPNALTSFSIIPNGTSGQTQLNLEGDSNLTNGAVAQFVLTNDVRLVSGIRGTGTYLPMTFFTGGSERVRVDTSGNVGIGTTSPGTKLDVIGPTGSVAAPAYLNQTSASIRNNWHSRLALVNGGAGFSGSIDSYATGASYPSVSLGMDNDGTVRFVTGSGSVATSEKMRITSAGDVGIGTASPGAKLEVYTTSSTSYGFVSQTPVVGLTANNSVNMAYFVNSRGTRNDGLRIINYRDSNAAGVGNWETESYSIERNVDNVAPQAAIKFGASSLRFDTAGNERLRIDSTGNVGIGTSSPATKLDVDGIVKARSGLQIGINTDINFNSGNDNNSRIRVNGTSGTMDLFGFLGYRFYTTSGGDNERMRIDSAGNVGIGTSSPGQKLDVKGISTATAVTIQAQSFDGASSVNMYSGANSTDNPSIVYQNSLRFGSATGLGVTGYTERMRLDASGNVGIGTSSPGSKLAVSDAQNGGVTLTSSNTGGYSFVQLQNTGGGRSWQLATGGSTSVYGGNLAIFDATASATRLTIDSSGNLGLGVTSPITTNARLSVKPAGDYDAALAIGSNASATNWARLDFKNTNSASPAILYQDQAGVFTVRTDGATPITFQTNATERARIDASGNLLVGTTSYSFSATNYGIGFKPNGETFWIVNTPGNIIAFVRNTVGNIFKFFYQGAEVGNVNVTTTSTAYVTSSDYRLKENVEPMTGALAKVAALKPCTYTWKADGSDGEGFIAHELQAVCPQAVTGEKDAVDEDGNPKYQGVDTSFLVATLVAAIQELTAKVEALEAAA